MRTVPTRMSAAALGIACLTSSLSAHAANDIARSDFNADGLTDYAVAESLSNRIGIHLNNGLGGLQNTLNINLGLLTHAVALLSADMNNDKFLDVVALTDTGLLKIILNDGLGGFNAPLDLSGGLLPGDLAGGDFNADGLLDLVSADGLTNQLHVFLNQGNGVMLLDESINVGLGPSSVTVADINNDGHVDLINTNLLSNSISFSLGDGQGDFAAAVSLPVGLAPTAVMCVDLNGDGLDDLISGNATGGNVSVLLSDGVSGYNPAVNLDVDGNSAELISLDINDDGHMDLIGVGGGSNGVSVLLGDGVGNLVEALVGGVLDDILGILPSLSDPTSIVAGDINQDCKPDLMLVEDLSDDPTSIVNQNPPVILDMIYCSNYDW